MNIDVLTDKQLALLREAVEQAEKIVVCCHKSPDGDALGAVLAWSEYLRMQGKEPTMIVPDAFPDFLKWLPGNEMLMRYDKHKAKADKIVAEADVVFCLDFDGLDRLGDMAQAMEGFRGRYVLMDHHTSPRIPNALELSFPSMCSTCELLFRMICQLGRFEQMTRKMAVALYTGMMTDTGGFTYNSTRPEIFFIIGQLLTRGIDKDKIYRNIFNVFSPWAIRLRGYLMSQKLNVFDDFHASYFTISRQDMKNFHFVKGDVEGLVNEPLKIKGMKLSISLREDDRRDHVVWVSLRSVDDFPCNQMSAEFFNGGGHLNASGGHLNCSLAEAEKVVRQAIVHYEKLLKG
ncbi:DHH family phosphoesterase [Prevotella sp. A2931]|uniref:DHH family phosphoesterase n=1 Tax=Prevotella illustrans TaxID=2800387 RepID=A0ABS3M4U9_9BACT|nr:MULTISPECIES: DHH family phosphoesterase [Prevotella]MBO1363199.1 DHH family phosphoesterase [Prevotella illustrans]PTL25333.1 DHH family phosphoesterase [Prevotella sp. oral taxon 820]